MNRIRSKGKLILFRFEEFMRRISTEDTLAGNYDKNVIDSIPCYVGWFFVRILPDGNVNSCLKSHRIPIGNIYEQGFQDIWISEKQQEFRRKAKVYKKDDPYFASIGNDPSITVGCYKSCDNLGHNQYVNSRLVSLGLRKKVLLKSGGHSSRKLDSFQCFFYIGNLLHELVQRDFFPGYSESSLRRWGNHYHTKRLLDAKK